MADSYTQLIIQLVFVVKHRDALIHENFEDRLHKYITSIIQNKGNKLLAINGMPDHLNIVIGLSPTIAIADLCRDVKKASTNFINENKLTKCHFEWQPGYAAFSYSKSSLSKLCAYVDNQKTHHQKTTFREELMAFFEEMNIKYESKYGFDFLNLTPPQIPLQT